MGARLLTLLLCVPGFWALRLSRRHIGKHASAAAAVCVAAPRVSSSAEAPTVPMDLGVVGLRKEGASGRLNVCPDRAIKRACISSSRIEIQDAYVPPLVYDKEGGTKALDTAVAELKAALRAQPGATVVESTLAGGRYVRAEFQIPAGGPFGATAVDDLEFLISKPGTSDPPALVDYRSATRPGADNNQKRHRERIKAVRLELEKSGWKSVGRLLM